MPKAKCTGGAVMKGDAITRLAAVTADAGREGAETVNEPALTKYADSQLR
jgi:hypothetical protein